MQGRMMFQPLLISSLLRHAAQYHSDTEIISKNTDGTITKTDWTHISENSKRFANALNALGMQHGDRIATIAWNNHRHLESWYGISGSGLVCHTINPRLFPEQLVFIINDAVDRVVMFDKTFLPLIKAVRPHIPNVEHFICLSAFDQDIVDAIPEAKFYDILIAEQSAEYEWPLFDETTASSLCYTSGTTGNPKGALYSHRSTVLQCYAGAMVDGMGVSSSDVMLPVVPMFHVNAWGTPYIAAMVGCTLVLPGPGLDGMSLTSLIDEFKVSVALGVPTIWQGLIQAAKASGSKLPSLKRNVVGGSACPPSMLKVFRDEFDCETVHAWGMTETSPLGSINQLKAKHNHLSDDEKMQVRLSQGRPPFGVELRITEQENGTQVQATDGETLGNLQIRGHWIIDSYYGKNESALTTDGWFDTGDIATLDQDGYMNLQDRAKDLIKSGGEWISSVELENIAMGHPKIAMAAAIAATHPKWDERPIIIAVKAPDTDVSEKEILDFYADKIAKWQIPDRVIFVEAIPLTGTGKMLKKDLRDTYGSILLAS